VIAQELRLHAYIRPVLWRALWPPGLNGLRALPPQHVHDLDSVSARSRVWKSRSNLLCHHHVTAHAIDWRDGLFRNLLSSCPPATGPASSPESPCRRAGSPCPPAGADKPAMSGRVSRYPAAVRRQAGGRYRSPFASKAQATRAVLLAWATLAQFIPRRALTPWSQRLQASLFRSTTRRTARAPWMSRVRR
jgi:hypothetical protein